ncbi:hypothetical protein [Eubacterium sp. 1001713B170207_170306_E7]|uniref:PglD-related sugar-binding protein n=1 Tax=Eubacterium sp. 1001713B170207_170306_E7 TaxID=2787097 RepID=UPI001A9AF54B|nr:hypothetical protein [Eubacterium sp. 1001713B170207_170306_E7]
MDDNIKRGTEIHGYPVIGTVEECVHYPEAHFLIGIGDNLTRKKIAETYELNYITAIHPTAVTSENVHIGNGTVVMSNAVINADAEIGKHCIINTSAVIEHECVPMYRHRLVCVGMCMWVRSAMLGQERR